ncbi:MAG: NAD(P)-dependent oxidoreductase [Candidatus Dormibacteraeota bacterium]|nr:NAD(P)-dependent oxidoreductase [Candidatus Dormibacteraeota bacterium]
MARILVTGGGTELGRLVVGALGGRRHTVASTRGRPSPDDLRRAVGESRASVVVNTAPQRANSLLSDGHSWRGLTAATIAETEALLASLGRRAFLVQTSFACLYGDAQGAAPQTPLSPPDGDPFAIAAAIEDQVAASAARVCTLRLGFLYGPASRDLWAYRRSFQLHRAHYAGPRSHLGPFLHQEDAARALVLAAERKPEGAVLNVADDRPAAFGDFIDEFARRLGFRAPWRMPDLAARLAPWLITPEQVELLHRRLSLDVSATQAALGWSPEFPDYESGLRQVAARWAAGHKPA